MWSALECTIRTLDGVLATLRSLVDRTAAESARPFLGSAASTEEARSELGLRVSAGLLETSTQGREQ
jgi:hypothetical protein